MNNGIFVQDIYGKPGYDIGLPKPLTGSPSPFPMPYYYPGGDWRLDSKNLILTIDLSLSSTTTIGFTAGGTASRNWSIDWGDGVIEMYTSFNNTTYLHTYNNIGIYNIQIIGDIYAPRFSSQISLIKIISMGQPTTNLDYTTAFRFNTNLVSVPKNLSTNPAGFVQAFLGCTKLNDPNISNWNTTNFTTINSIFFGCSLLNQNLGLWNTSNITNLSQAFTQAFSFNNGGSTDINNWNTSSVTDMSSMFNGASSFNQPLNNWNVRKVTNFTSMFNGASSFNSSLSGWALGADTAGANCSSMFQGSAFNNSSISSWDTSKVTNMGNMFFGANSFDQNIGSWNTSSVTDMSYMFSNNTTPISGFNNGGSSSISGWNTSNVTNMSFMFANRINFNQPIGSWNVSKVTNMSYMFQNSYNFNQDISNWNLAGLNANTSLDGFMLNKTGANAISTTNYDALLIGWNNNKLAATNGVANWRTDLRPNFGGAKYTAGGAAATARAALVSYGWTITDGGSV